MVTDGVIICETTMIQKIFFCLALCFPLLAQAQEMGIAYAQMKVCDKDQRFPKVSEIEFLGSEEPVTTRHALCGDGVMWESDYVGFRISMDHRQTIDLYGKKQAQRELDKTNFNTRPELMNEGYGRAILSVGNRIGAGSFRGCRDGRPCLVDTVKARGQRIINPGPKKTIVEMWDQDWQINGKKVQMRQTFTMLPGHRDVQVDIYLEGASDKDVFFTGAQKLEINNSAKTGKLKTADGQKGLCVATWGSNVPDKDAPELVEALGIAVFVPNDFVADSDVIETSTDYLIPLHPVKGHIRYHLVACADMQADGGWHKDKDWFNWIWKKLELPKQKK